MLLLRLTILFTLICLAVSLCFGQLTHERGELGSPNTQVNLNSTISLPNDITVLFGSSTLTAPYMQATAIAIDAQGDELWRYGYGEPSYNGYSEFFLAIEHTNGVRLYAENPVYFTDSLDLRYIDLDLLGNPLDTTPLNILAYERPTSVYQIDSSSHLFLFNRNTKQRIVGIDDNGNEFYNIEYDYEGRFRSESTLIELGNSFGVIHREAVYAIDFANQSVSKIYRADTLSNGLPNGSLVPVLEPTRRFARGVLQYFKRFQDGIDHTFLQLNVTGDIVNEQELSLAEDFNFVGDAIILDSIIHVAQRLTGQLDLASFDLRNNGERTYFNTVFDSPDIRLVFPEVILQPIQGRPFLLQQFYKEGLQNTFENSLVDFQTLDTISQFQDARDLAYFNPIEYVVAGDKLFIKDNTSGLLAIGASYTAYDNTDFSQQFSLFTEGIPDFINPLRVEETTQHMVSFSDIEDSQGRISTTEVHCFDTLGNTLWSHESSELLSAREFYPTPDGYLWHKRFSRDENFFVIKSIDGVSGLENWELNLPVVDSTSIWIEDVETKADSTFLLIKNTRYGSNSTITHEEAILYAVDGMGNIIWSTLIQEASTYFPISDIALDANDSLNVFSYAEFPINNGSPSNENASWTRLSASDGGKQVAFTFTNNAASSLAGVDYSILDFQRVAFLENSINGGPRTLKLLDLQDTTTISLISRAEVISKLDRFYSIDKRGNVLFIPGATDRHGLHMSVLNSLSFNPRVAPAFQAPTTSTGLRTTLQEIELLQNPVGNEIDFLTRIPVALDEVKLYSLAGKEVPGTVVTQFSDGTIRVELLQRPTSGVYILNIGDASEQVIIR